MVKFLYTLLLIGVSASVGLALIMGALYRRLYKTLKARGQYTDALQARGMVKTGLAITNGVLIYALGQTPGDVDVNARTWLYLAGLVVLTAGLGWEAIRSIEQLARLEGEAIRELPPPHLEDAPEKERSATGIMRTRSYESFEETTNEEVT